MTKYRDKKLQAAFTLLELLVVIVIIALLAAATTISINAVIEQAKRVSCASNLRHLFLANTLYALDNGMYVPASRDLFGANLTRWHGTRKNSRVPFNGAEGPLAPYLEGHMVRSCRSFRHFETSNKANAFEAACGGYGYNAVGVGSLTCRIGMCFEANFEGMPPEDIADPSSTIMFCDAAFPQPYGSNPKYLIEYSFAEPYHWVIFPGAESSFRADPSIHFRHNGRANVVWCDGHISSERLNVKAEDHFTRFKIGWFGTPDNSYFAPKPVQEE